MTDLRTSAFLELVCRELGAADAWVQLGGRAPVRPELLFAALPDGARVVVELEEAPPERAPLVAKLEALVESFSGAFAEERPSPPSLRSVERRLALELEALRLRAEAEAAVIVDLTTEMLWAAAPAGRFTDLEALAVAADADRTSLDARLLAAVELARSTDQLTDDAVLARSFAQIYRVVLVFEERARSMLHSQTALLHALPLLEGLVLALPPVEPPRGPGARVVSLRSRG